MKTQIFVTFTKSDSPQVYSDTISVEWTPAPHTMSERITAALARKLRKFTRTPATVVSWSVA